MARMTPEPYYRPDLALVHDRGFGFHADRCAPGILALLEPVRERNGLVLELGCGSGSLTRHLVTAGHRVVASDASPAMLELARAHLPGVELVRLTLPDDPLPEADAVVSVGHCLSYLPSPRAIDEGLLAACAALRPGGILAIDLCDLSYADRPVDVPYVQVTDEWAIVTRYATPSPERFDRDITTFLRQEDGTWRRDDEHHENVLVDTSRIPALVGPLGVEVEVRRAFRDEELPHGLVALVGRRPPPP